MLAGLSRNMRNCVIRLYLGGNDDMYDDDAAVDAGTRKDCWVTQHCRYL